MSNFKIDGVFISKYLAYFLHGTNVMSGERCEIEADEERLLVQLLRLDVHRLPRSTLHHHHLRTLVASVIIQCAVVDKDVHARTSRVNE